MTPDARTQRRAGVGAGARPAVPRSRRDPATPIGGQGGRALAWLLGVASVLALGVVLVASAARVVRERQVAVPDALARLDAGPVGQGFRASAPGLTGIDLVVTAVGRGRVPPIRFRLREESGGAVRVSLLLAPRHLPLRHEFLAVRFPPLPDSAGRRFVVTVEAEGLEAGRVAVWGAAGDAYPDGTALVAGRPQAGDLAFRAVYRVGPREALGVLAERLTAGRPGPFGQPGAYLLLAALSAAGEVALLALLRWAAPLGRPGRQRGVAGGPARGAGASRGSSDGETPP